MYVEQYRSLFDPLSHNIATGPGVRIVNSYMSEPIYLSRNVSVVDSTIGRYTGFADGAACGNATVGAFCCIAAGAAINPFQHPVRWLSSHGFQYHRGGFDFVSEYAALTKLPYANVAQRDIKVGNDVWIGHGASIMANVDDGAIIGAGAVVTKDIPAYAVAVGNPADIEYFRFDEVTISRLLRTKWWEMPLSALEGLPFDRIEKCLDILEARKL